MANLLWEAFALSRFLFAMVASRSLFAADNPSTLAVGPASHASSLPGIDGKLHSLPDEASPKVPGMDRCRELEFDIITVSTNLPAPGCDALCASLQP